MSAFPDAAPQDPALVATLPFLYIAWADGLLTPTEIATIRTRLEAQPWMTDAARTHLTRWLNPAQPPTPAEYKAWIRTIRSAANDLPDEAHSSLARLGVEMANRVGGGDGAPYMGEEALTALADLEDALGVLGEEAFTDLLETRPAEPEPAPAPETTFDVGAMTALLDGDYAALRQKIRTLLRDPVFRYLPPDTPTDERREQTLDWCRRLARQGLGALSYPKEHGGQDDLARFLVAFESIAYHDLSLVIKYGVQFGLWGGSVHQLGTEKHHAQYLRDIGTLDLPGCFAMTELGHGSNVRELLTTATYDPDREVFILHTPEEAARKEYIGNAARHGQMATVFAQLHVGGEHHGVHAFVVPIRDESGEPMPGVRIGDNGVKLGLNGVDNGRLWFDQVAIPRENLLDRFATVSPDGTYSSPIPSLSKRFFTMLSTLVGGRISVASAALSAAKSGLTIAIRYNDRRRQFGPKDGPEVSILDYRTQQRRLLPLLANAYALHFALGYLRDTFVARREHEDDLRAAEALASGLKAWSTWNTTHTLQTGRECCGGQGYMAENRFAALKADSDIFTTFEGDNTVLMLQVAKARLSAFKQQFHDMNFFGMVRHLTVQAAGSFLAMNPLVIRNTDPAHLRSAEFQLDAFRFREQSLQQSVARRLKRRIDRGMDSYDAFIECQDHLLQLAFASVERKLLEVFVESIDACQDATLRPVLDLLRSLFALHRIEQDKGWFLEHNVLSDGKGKAVTQQVNALCAEVRPLAVPLVDSFAIPDELIAAPIGL